LGTLDFYRSGSERIRIYRLSGIHADSNPDPHPHTDFDINTNLDVYADIHADGDGCTDTNTPTQPDTDSDTNRRTCYTHTASGRKFEYTDSNPCANGQSGSVIEYAGCRAGNSDSRIGVDRDIRADSVTQSEKLEANSFVRL
jgi:hypothetical protein